jgi:hypothetical protein
VLKLSLTYIWLDDSFSLMNPKVLSSCKKICLFATAEVTVAAAVPAAVSVTVVEQAPHIHKVVV